MRRVLAPLGGAISFLLVALLVLGGLTWVTIESLHVEEERRLATARADSTQSERLALWRLDGRLFPSWGVENNRPYAQYFAYYTPYPCWTDAPNSELPRVASPLLSAELPDWMKLHFQLDPETGWDSPQVMSNEGEAKLRGHLLELFEQVPENVNGNRSVALGELRTRFPAQAAHEFLLKCESNLDDSPLVVPYNEPPKAQAPMTPGGVTLGNMGLWNQERVQFGGVLEFQNKSVPAVENKKLEDQQSRSTGGTARGGLAGSAADMPVDPANKAPIPAQSQGRATPTPLPAPQVIMPPTGYEARANTGKRGTDDVRQNSIAANSSGTSNFMPPVDAAKTLPAKDDITEAKSKTGDATSTQRNAESPREKSAAMPKATPMKSEQAPAAPPAGGLRPVDLPQEEAEKNVARKSCESTKAQEMPRDFRDWFFGNDNIRDRNDDRLAAADGLVPPMRPEPPDVKKTLLNVTLRPPSVQLGPMRPIWLKNAQGDEALVLVRAAKLETKIVFQGVLLDWPRLQTVLTEEVRSQLPEAKLVRMQYEGQPSERCMTALPATLDPGPQPSPPPAGWTPLRIGLALGWLAALLALAAAGFVGWTLIDLSERRIRFVSAVTHELRTPLTAMRLSTDLLSTGMIADEEKQKEHLRILGHESERLNVLIENVLDFAKLEKRSVQAQCAPLTIADLFEQVKQTWSERLTNEGRELVIVSTLPPEQTLTTDARIASQILGNLIDNARKYTREAEEKRIWLWARPGGTDRVVLEVEDRGPGVPASERDFIFRPFRRGQNVSATGGAGLGLALAKQWADLLGGTLSYRPADGGVGACFRLELPSCC